MDLEIRGLGLDPTPMLRHDIERQLRHGLRRFDSRLERVTVRLFRADGHGRHASRRCLVTVAAHGLAPLRIAASGRTVEGAFALAASRARRELARELGVRRRTRRATRVPEVPLEWGAAGDAAAPLALTG